MQTLLRAVTTKACKLRRWCKCLAPHHAKHAGERVGFCCCQLELKPELSSSVAARGTVPMRLHTRAGVGLNGHRLLVVSGRTPQPVQHRYAPPLDDAVSAVYGIHSESTKVVSSALLPAFNERLGDQKAEFTSLPRAFQEIDDSIIITTPGVGPAYLHTLQRLRPQQSTQLGHSWRPPPDKRNVHKRFLEWQPLRSRNRR
jgi:hypothetical protein